MQLNIFLYRYFPENWHLWRGFIWYVDSLCIQIYVVFITGASRNLLGFSQLPWSQWMCSFEMFQVETVNMTLMNVRNHQNCATMAYVSIVQVCIVQRNILWRWKHGSLLHFGAFQEFWMLYVGNCGVRIPYHAAYYCIQLDIRWPPISFHCC
jgi:hypothetical protein